MRKPDILLMFQAEKFKGNSEHWFLGKCIEKPEPTLGGMSRNRQVL